MRSDITVENRAVGGIYVVAGAFAAVLAGPIILFLLSDGRIMRAREVLGVVGPIHFWVAAVICAAVVVGVALGDRRVVALGKYLVAFEPGRTWLTLVPWAVLLAITIITTALYGQHGL